MQTLRLNPHIDGDYEIFVMAMERAWLDDQSLEVPRVSIVWKVIRFYKSEYCNVLSRIKDFEKSQEFEFDIPHSYNDAQSAISNMISGLDIPFQLDRLRWKMMFGVKYLNDKDLNETDQLNGVDAMISKILHVVNQMVLQASLAGQKKLQMVVNIEKRILVPHEQYRAINRDMIARGQLDSQIRSGTNVICYEIRQLEDCLRAMREGLGAFRQINADLISDEIQQLEVERREVSEERESLWQSYKNTAKLLSVHVEKLVVLGNRVVRARNQVERIWSDIWDLWRSPRPASKESVEALEKFVYGGLQDQSHDGLSDFCVVCFEKMLIGDQVTRMPCSHMFHGSCILEWLKKGHTCPVCRFKLPVVAAN